MTRKDYVLIAGALNRAFLKCEETESMGVYLATVAMMEALKADNPAFDGVKFVQAVRAGVPS